LRRPEKRCARVARRISVALAEGKAGSSEAYSPRSSGMAKRLEDASSAAIVNGPGLAGDLALLNSATDR